MNKDNQKGIIDLESKERSRVTYSELSDDFSHFEIAYLSFQKAIEIIRSAVYLNYPEQKTKYKPKVAVVALDQLCNDKPHANQFKEEVQKQMFADASEEGSADTYNVDEGHLPKQDAENS